MKKSPTPRDIRRALARLSKRFQPLFTWITGLALPGETRRRPWTAGSHVAALLVVYALTLAAGIAGVAIGLDLMLA